MGFLKLREDRPATIEEHRALRDEISLLRKPWRGVDDQDWQYIASVIPDGGRGRFWKQVLAEMRAALSTGRETK